MTASLRWCVTRVGRGAGTAVTPLYVMNFLSTVSMMGDMCLRWCVTRVGRGAGTAVTHPFVMFSVKAQLHYKTELNSTVLADKDQGPKTIQSLGLGLEYTKTEVLDPATL